MGNTDTEKPTKNEKPTSPHQAQGNNVHVYPDWAAVQSYYGPGVMPPPYFNPAVTPGHPPHPYMWAPPQMMPPYGSPYAAIYPHGGIYGHSPAPVVATPLSIETPTRLSGNDSGSAKKLKESGHQIPLGNGNVESGGEGGTQGQSQSDCGTEGSCDRSDDSTAREGQNGIGQAGKLGSEATPYPALEATRGNGAGPVHAVVPGVPKASGMTLQVGCQDEREIKREKRKQSNRESARRSRLRKQAEMEELGKKVDSLTVENLALRSEINKLIEDSEKLRSENAVLMEKLKNLPAENNAVSERGEDQGRAQISTENFLSKVENAASNGLAHHNQEDDEK